MQLEQLEFDNDQQQAIFGIQDRFIRIIEKALDVSIRLRDSKLDILGQSETSIERTKQVIRSMQNLNHNREELSEDIVYRLIEEASEGNIEETTRAMGDVVTITHKGAPIKCKTIGQKNYIKALRENIVTICIGPAGTGKTFLAVAQAVDELKRGDIDRIIMSRPAIEAGDERLGFLPGDLAQKVDPYLRPLYDALYDTLGQEKAERLREKGTIEIAPLAYMRGRTLNRARVIVDESQNASMSTLKMILTRLGEGSKMVLTGDVTQIDLPKASDSGLERCAAILQSIDEIAVMRLTNRDVVRNRIVKDIVKAFEKYEKQAEARAGRKR